MFYLQRHPRGVERVHHLPALRRGRVPVLGVHRPKGPWGLEGRQPHQRRQLPRDEGRRGPREDEQVDDPSSQAPRQRLRGGDDVDGVGVEHGEGGGGSVCVGDEPGDWPGAVVIFF